MFGQSTEFGKNNGVSGPRGFVGIYPLKHLYGSHIVTACRATYYTKLSTNNYPITSLFAVVLFLRYISVAGLVQWGANQLECVVTASAATPSLLGFTST